jgi:hypothetical protein
MVNFASVYEKIQLKYRSSNLISQPAQSSFEPTKSSADDGFGIFQSHEKDAWSMGQGLGELFLLTFSQFW